MAQAEKVVHHILYKAPVRDLILGAATLVLLVVLGAQSRLMVSEPRTGITTPGTVMSKTPVAAPDAAQARLPAPAAPEPATRQPATIVSAVPPRGRVKAAPAPAHEKEVVVPSATLDLGVQHQFKDATLFLYVDDKLALTRTLHGGAQKKLIVFNAVRGVQSETVQVPAGKHQLRVRALSSDQTTDLSRTITADFVGGDDKSLEVTFEKHNSVMRLTWQ